MSADRLSLTGHLLLLSIDPGSGGLLRRHRRRFRKALAAAHRADRGWTGASVLPAGRAQMSARRELEHAGLVHPRPPFSRIQLADRTEAGRLFRRLTDGLQSDVALGPRDQQVLVLLAWAGVLGHRLSRYERRLALRKIRALVLPASGGGVVPPAHGAQAPLTEAFAALGVVGLHVLDDVFSGDVAGFDGVAGAFGGGDGGGGGEGGGY